MRCKHCGRHKIAAYAPKGAFLCQCHEVTTGTYEEDVALLWTKYKLACQQSQLAYDSLMLVLAAERALRMASGIKGMWEAVKTAHDQSIVCRNASVACYAALSYCERLVKYPTLDGKLDYVEVKLADSAAMEYRAAKECERRAQQSYKRTQAAFDTEDSNISSIRTYPGYCYSF